MANKKEGSVVDFEEFNLGALRVPRDDWRKLAVTLSHFKQVSRVNLSDNKLIVEFNLGSLQGEAYRLARSVLKNRIDQAINHKVLKPV